MSRNWKTKVLSAGAALGFCGVLVAQVAHADGSAVQVRHPTGFSIDVPTGFSARVQGDTLILQEVGDLRAPRAIEVGAIPAEDRPAPSQSRRQTAHGPAAFQINEVGSGSGGTLWQLDAAIDRAVSGNDAPLRLRATQQTELGKPEFSFAWDVLESVR